MTNHDLAERMKVMRQTAQKARDLLHASGETWFNSDHLQVGVVFTKDDAEHIAQCDPDSIFALITLVEQQGREIEELKRK